MSQVVSQPPTGGVPGGNSLWNKLKEEGRKAGVRASIAAQQTKLTAEIMMIDRKIEQRKKKFGQELYDTLVVHAEQDPNFIIDGDSLENIRGHFVMAFKDNKALLQKKAVEQQNLVTLEERKVVSRPAVPDETISGQMKSAGIAANFMRQEQGCKNRISVIEGDMRSNKRKFGVAVYATLVQLEDDKKWLSPDRDVRFLYDAARRDITKICNEKLQKEEEWSALGETSP